MINNNSVFFIKCKILSFFLKTKIKKLDSLLKKSNCDLQLYKAKFLNVNQENIAIEDYHNSWKILTRLMMKKSFGNAIENILTTQNKYLKLINPSLETTYEPINFSRKFNTVFSITFFSRIICENNVKYKDQLVELSKNIVNSLLNIINQSHPISLGLTLFCLVMKTNQYYEIFEKWQECDKEFMVFNLAKQYLLNEIKMNKPLSNVEEHKQIYLQAFKREQSSIKQDIRYVASGEWLDKFNELIEDTSNYDSVVKKLYWLDIDYNLYKTPPNKDTILKLFLETKRLMKNLVLNRIDLLQEIEGIIDEDIIKVVLNEPEIDEPFYYNKCEYITNKLQQLQSPAMDKPLEDFKSEFALKINQRVYFKDLIPFFFRFVLDSLERIHVEKQEFIDFLQAQNQNQN
jgi:hypothetical protein